MANLQYSAGIVTAYGAARRGGYTGSYEEFCIEQAGFAEAARQVREDKESVEQTVETFSEETVPEAVQSVTDEGTRQIGLVNDAGDDAVEAVGNAGTENVSSVNRAGSAKVEAVNNAGTTQVGNVNQAGATQVQAVEDKGEEVLESIPADYTELSNAVNDPVTGLDTKAPAIVNTASGAIASFSDGADSMPVKKLVVSIEPVQAGTGDPSPDNERPITGWTGAKIEQGNQNYVDTAATGKSFNTTGVDTDVSGMYATEYIPVSPGETLLYKFTSVSGAMTRRVCLYDAQKVFVSMPYNATWVTVGKTEERKITIPDGVAYARATGLASDRNKMICAKYSATTVTFPSSAGTVYGATLTINSDRTGSLVLNNYRLTRISADWSWYETTVNSQRYFNSSSVRTALINTKLPVLMCDHFKAITRADGQLNDNSIPDLTIMNAWARCYPLNIRYDAMTTLDDFKAYLTENEVYALLPTYQSIVTYTLTESEISSILSTLYGTNNIWADCGDTEVTYTADTKLYIEQLTQPTEDDMTANANISANKFFMIGNTLYFSTSAISAGEAIVPGTNCNLVSLADALNQLNT